VRVNVQLIKAKTNEHLWVETYDRKLTDVFVVETEIAKAVADKLQARLSDPEERAIAAQRSENPAAHQFYVKGRFFWNKTTEPDLRKAIDYFTQAIAADPSYTLAYVGIADANLLLPFIAGGRPQDCYPAAKQAAQKALALDDAVAEAHIALAEALRVYDFDYAQGATEFQRGLELNPNDATGHWRYSWLLASLGRTDDAVREMKLAVELDPLSLIINTDLGYLYTVFGRADEAIEQLRRTVEMDPNFYYAHGNLGEALEVKGSFQEALAEYQKTQELTPDPFALAELAHVHAALGNKRDAEKFLVEMHEVAKKRYVQAFTFAVAHLAVGDKEQALGFLEQSYEDHDGGALAFIRIDPFLAQLRGDPRFEQLAEKIVPRLGTTATNGPEKSIAVLPFLDLSQAKDQEYFCDGISEQILDSLAKVPGLQVAARTSSFSLKGTKLGAKEIAGKLGVRHLLEGSLRRDGNRIRVSAQLINAQTGFHLWSDTFERELQGVFALQDEITQAITNALKLKLAVAPAPATQNTEAYDLYLQGVFFSNKSTEEGLRRGLELFQRSLEKDPGSARAWAGIAKTWNWLADAYVRPLEAFPEMKAAAEKAVALDPDNAEAHIWMGEAKRILDWDMEGFKAELDRALKLDPNSATAHIFLGLYEGTQGNKNASVAHIRESVRLDPLSPIVGHFAAMGYMCLDRMDEAMTEGIRTLQIDPNYIYESPILANVYNEKGMFPEAIALFSKAQQMTGQPQPGLAISYARTGRKEEAREILEQLKKLEATKYYPAEEIAAVYVALGENDEAFNWLEKACSDHGGAIHAIPMRPVFKALRGDPRFRELGRRIGLDASLLLDQVPPP
jgi:TolB-like protein/Tfp pilus assembly protein PilF